jgi:hypothetical protein
MSWIKALAISVFALLAPIHTVMATAGALILLDLILGVIAAHKRKEPITSAALRRTVSKMVAYQLGIVSGFLAQHYMLSDSLPIVKLMAAAIALVEIKSIMENADSINGSPLFQSVIKALGSKNDDKTSPPSPPDAA